MHFCVSTYTKFASYGKYVAKITVPKKCYCWRDKKLQAALLLSEEEALARFFKALHICFALERPSTFFCIASTSAAISTTEKDFVAMFKWNRKSVFFLLFKTNMAIFFPSAETTLFGNISVVKTYFEKDGQGVKRV